VVAAAAAAVVRSGPVEAVPPEEAHHHPAHRLELGAQGVGARDRPVVLHRLRKRRRETISSTANTRHQDRPPAPSRTYVDHRSASNNDDGARLASARRERGEVRRRDGEHVAHDDGREGGWEAVRPAAGKLKRAEARREPGTGDMVTAVLI
jgi:hypothetical protein